MLYQGDPNPNLKQKCILYFRLDLFIKLRKYKLHITFTTGTLVLISGNTVAPPAGTLFNYNYEIDTIHL